MSQSLPSVETAGSAEDPRLLLIASPIGHIAMYPGTPIPVTSKPYADMLQALDTASRIGYNADALQRVTGPENLAGMRAEFARAGVELPAIRTLPQAFCEAAKAGHLQTHRSMRPRRVFAPRQLQILDYAALGFTKSEIPALMHMTEAAFNDELTQMGRQAHCGAGLLRLMRKACELQARSIEFSLTPHKPVTMPDSWLQALIVRSNGNNNEEAAAERSVTKIAQQQHILRLHKRLNASRITEATAKAIVLGLIPVLPRKPTGEPLSDRQLEVLTLVALGHKGPAIAEIMGVDENSVTTFVAQVRGKFGVKNTEQAVRHAFEDGTFLVAPAAA